MRSTTARPHAWPPRRGAAPSSRASSPPRPPPRSLLRRAARRGLPGRAACSRTYGRGSRCSAREACWRATTTSPGKGPRCVPPSPTPTPTRPCPHVHTPQPHPSRSPPRAPGPGRACAARLARQRARLRRRAPGRTRLFVTSDHPASFFLFKGASLGATLGGDATVALKFAASS